MERPAIIMDDGQIVRVGELRDLTSQYAQALAALGVGSNLRVGVLSKNRSEVVLVSNALLLTNSCLVPLHPMGSLDDYEYVIEDAGIDTLIFDPQYFQEQAAALQKRFPQLTRLLALGPTGVGMDLTAEARNYRPAALVAPEIKASDMVRLAYSGGTTGKPKGIMISQQSWLTMCNILLTDWEWPVEIRHLVCAPLSHSGASVLIAVLSRGGALVVVPGFEPLGFMQAVQKHKITSTLMVPTMIYALLDHPRLAEFDLGSLETIFYGASSISPPRLQESIRRLGPIFYQFYGQTEAPMAITGLRRAEHDANNLQRLASCGRPTSWVHMALLDSNNQPVADGQPGEICARGPLVCSGYLNKPEQTAEAFAGGWLHTGDVAIRDAEGFLYIVDRKKDMIITGGFNVYPSEVEDVIARHPAVAAVGVVGVPDDRWGEAVKAVVVLRAGHSIDADALIALVREHKGPVQAPKSVDFVDALPLTSLGKPDKKALRAHYINAQP